MTEQNQGEESKSLTGHLSDDEKKVLADSIGKQYSKQDDELQTVLDLMFGPEKDVAGNILPITLITSGGVISGLAVAFPEWEEAFWKNFDIEPIKQVAARTRQLLQEVQDRSHQGREEMDLPRPPRRYIHLKNVTVRVGSNFPYSLPFMRVYIKDISAWSIGDLGGYQE